MKLYYAPGACSLAPRIALQEAGLPYEAAQVDLRALTLADGTDFKTINPLGYVPLLELDDGRCLLENAAILQYIADLAPDKQLAPANGSFARYKLQERLNFIATEVHKRFGALFHGASEDLQTEARTQLRALFAWLDGELKNQDYQFGATFTVADGYLFTVLRWASLVKVDLGGLDRLMAFKSRVAARPAVRQAVADDHS
ncbi:glutathione S-transferase [Betaproteobacteria bacterium]|nr:glutathione S-transferase [Betaproteobacteria bacterium]GHU41842.1 glutathione S-transferase [Betaproteobacteria bacterium]